VQYEGFADEHRVLAGSKLVRALQGVHVLITEVDQVKGYVLAKTPDLRVIACCRGDPVNIDVRATTEHSIPVLRTPGRNAVAVAELTVLFMLALLRRFQPASALLRQPGDELEKLARAFFEYRGAELWEKTVGLIGLGAVGRRVAQRLQPFDAHVVACDPYVSNEQAAAVQAVLVSLDELLVTADVVSLHAPLTEETQGLLGEREFRRMKPGAYLVNTARAELTDEAALYSALQEGHLAGAALDVFVDEPPAPDHPLLGLPNVIATPHVGGNTHEVVTHQSRIVVADLIRLLEGDRPAHVVNPEVLERFRWPEGEGP
jgi:autoinducer 2 (AI-2) kinase